MVRALHQYTASRKETKMNRSYRHWEPEDTLVSIVPAHLTERPHTVEAEDIAAADEPVQCGWFALCRREATGHTEHPVLGLVPTCTRCHYFATGECRGKRCAPLTVSNLEGI